MYFSTRNSMMLFSLTVLSRAYSSEVVNSSLFLPGKLAPLNSSVKNTWKLSNLVGTKKLKPCIDPSINKKNRRIQYFPDRIKKVKISEKIAFQCHLKLSWA
uniref:Secreted protein n=1 Tax=Cacopsylla melanoneura TaxID=428564 RepID=A0A8D9ECB7_9HEMI